MSHKLFRLAAQIQNKPLLATEEMASSVMVYINQRLAGNTDPSLAVNLKPVTGHSEDFVSYKEDGVAFINVFGGLTHRMSMVDAVCTGGLSSYQGLCRAFDEAIADTTVDKIVLMIDSGGGEAAGCFELVRHIRESSGNKPVIAYVDERACSAAYALACSASEVYATPNAEVGSIGVLVIHQEYSEALKKEGIKTEIIKAGEVKGMGNPFEPLSEQAKDLIQKSVDSFYDSFTGLVSESRGISVESVKETGARVYGVKDALSLNLIDGVKTTDEFKDYIFGNSESSAKTKVNTPASEKEMSTEDLKMDTEKENAYKAQIEALQAQVAATEVAKMVSDIQPHADAIGIDAKAAVAAIGTVGADSDTGKFMTDIIHKASAKIGTLNAEAEKAHNAAMEAVAASTAMKEVGSDGDAPIAEDEEENPATSMEEARAAALADAIAKLNHK